MEYSGARDEGTRSLKEKVDRVPHVVATTPFTISQAMLTSRDRVQGVVVRGIDPKTEGTVTSLGKNMVEGSLARPGSRRTGRFRASSSGRILHANSGSLSEIRLLWSTLSARKPRWAWSRRCENSKWSAFSTRECTITIPSFSYTSLARGTEVFWHERTG